jgi:hypothetical protein
LLKGRIADIDDFLEAVNHAARGGTAIDPEIVVLRLGKLRRGDISSSLDVSNNQRLDRSQLPGRRTESRRAPGGKGQVRLSSTITFWGAL